MDVALKDFAMDKPTGLKALQSALLLLLEAVLCKTRHQLCFLDFKVSQWVKLHVCCVRAHVRLCAGYGRVCTRKICRLSKKNRQGLSASSHLLVFLSLSVHPNSLWWRVTVPKNCLFIQLPTLQHFSGTCVRELWVNNALEEDTVVLAMLIETTLLNLKSI